MSPKITISNDLTGLATPIHTHEAPKYVLYKLSVKSPD